MTEKREIKFRGLTKDGVWVYGWYIEFLDCSWISQLSSRDVRLFNESFVEVLPETVGQYTGLKDKNGKEEAEIYADDRIIITDGNFEAIGIVKMNDETGQWIWLATEVEASALTVYKEREIPLWKVLDKQYRWKGCLIGNIHQNPKLLEE